MISVGVPDDGRWEGFVCFAAFVQFTQTARKRMTLTTSEWSKTMLHTSGRRFHHARCLAPPPPCMRCPAEHLPVAPPDGWR